LRKYDAVLFDVDGTLLETSEGIMQSLREMMEHFGYEVPDDEELITFIGPPIEMSLENKLGLTGEENKKATMYFRDRYSNHNLMGARVYPGIMELLDYLKSEEIPMAIATYKKQDYATKICLGFGFGEYTDLIFGSDYEGKLAKADIIDLCIEKLDIRDKKRILMVGDSQFDALGAQKAGVSFAAVSYGFGFGKIGGEDVKLYPHDHYVNSPEELITIFEN